MFLDSFLNIISPAGVKRFVRTFQDINVIAAHFTSMLVSNPLLRRVRGQREDWVECWRVYDFRDSRNGD
jgi:hypothetical protein